ncbi:hypothetical protein [Bacillus salacetis]|nr:hypothetical protein [Bacillus salacetis]
MLAHKAVKWANGEEENEGCWSEKRVNGPMRKKSSRDAGPYSG